MKSKAQGEFDLLCEFMRDVMIAGWIRNGKDAKDLAAAAGLSAASISFIRRGKVAIGMQAWMGLATAFGMSLEESLDRAQLWQATRSSTERKIAGYFRAATKDVSPAVAKALQKYARVIERGEYRQ